MAFPHRLCRIQLAALLVAGACGASVQAQPVETHVEMARTVRYAEGSPGAAQSGRWLVSQLSPGTRWYGNPSTLGEVTVSATASHALDALEAGHPPIPAVEGDTYTIAGCHPAEGLSQTWTFTYNADARSWTINGYHVLKVDHCPAGG